MKRDLLTVLGWTIGGSVAATFVFHGGRFDMTWRRFAVETGTSMLFSSACVSLCVFGLPRVVPFVHRRLRFPFDWLAIGAALIAFGIAGSFTAALITLAMGLVQPPIPFMSWYPNSMKISIYFTVIFGLGGTVIEELRGRLAHTTLALRTKERDEAEARRLAAEAQFVSLEARVDPHFFFNTLNSIAALVRDRPADAERVIEQLSSLMRSSLDRRASLVSIGEELDLVRSYLEIEQIRFGDRLRFTIDVPAGLSSLVPRLSLQTIVENSVKYAVSPSREGAAISITAAARDGHLTIDVKDDGPGFDGASLPDGHGLQLLRSRLAMMFGDRASLAVDGGPGGTIVRLEIPA